MGLLIASIMLGMVSGDRFVITANGQTVFSESRTTLRVWWAETTWQMQRLRDNPECADQNIRRNQTTPIRALM